MLEDDVEDKDENGPHTSAGSLWGVGKVQKDLRKRNFHLNLLERRDKVAGGALGHVDVASEERVGQTSKQPVRGDLILSCNLI